MISLIRRLFVIAFLTSVSIPVHAQTCSCAGAPLISSQSPGTSAQGQWLLGMTYEFHEISSVYNGTTLLKGDETRRSTQSALFEANYGITDRLGVTGTFTYVRKDRESGRAVPGTGNQVITSGLGDGLITFNYQLVEQSLWNRYGFSLTGGLKMPLGSTSRTHNGFMLNADMQPGTGAWDGVIGGRFSVSLLPHLSMNVFTDTRFRKTGSNPRFGENDEYAFGNELVSNLGFAGEINQQLNYTLQMRYRSTSSDERNGNSMPNTGGYWLSAVPAINYSFSDRVGIRVSGQLPLHQKLNGTQPSTTFTVNGSLFINFNQPQQDFTYGTP